MLRLASLGWGARRIAGSWAAATSRCGAICGRGLAAVPIADAAGARWAHATGWRSGSAGIAATADVVRQDLAARARHHGEPAHGGAGGGAAAARSWRRRRGPRCASRRRRATSCRSTSAACAVPVEGEPRRVHPVRGHARLLAPHLCARVPARAPVGLAGGPGRRVPALRRHCRARCWSTTPARWSTQHDARTREVRLQRPLPRLLPLLGRPAAGVRAVPGAHQGQGRARRRLRQAQRHRRPPLRVAGGSCRRIWRAGCARWPTCACTAPRARRRSRASSATRRRRCEPLPAGAVPAGARASAARCTRDACVELDTNRYSVPWRLIGESGHAWSSASGRCGVRTPGQEVACHATELAAARER